MPEEFMNRFLTVTIECGAKNLSKPHMVGFAAL
jgi:hypothetical protein